MAENKRPLSPPRDLDWEMLALKLAIINPSLYAAFAGFSMGRYEDDQPHWITSYADAQKALGIYPLNSAEGTLLQDAVQKLLGCE